MKRKLLPWGMALLALCLQPQAFAAEVESPRDRGFYLAPMGTYVLADEDWPADDGVGGTLGLGFRAGSLAAELSGSMVDLDAENGGDDVSLESLGANVLFFPFDSGFMSGMYGLAGIGYMGIDDFTVTTTTPGLLGPTTSTVQYDDSTHYLQAGLGWLIPLSFGKYDFAIRAEALARHLELSEPPPGPGNPDRDFNDGVFNLGLQLPFGLRSDPPPPPPPAPVAVVKPLSICADGNDNDGDGAIDYPADPGCTSADDSDETDPPQCSDGKDNDGDGLIDFPDDKGCESASDLDEADPCAPPKPGERISLKGCGTGDIIVLKGVNFDFDKATLTSNAKSILDGVSEDLNAYSDIKVELSGHTDSRGSDSYNQNLSERRAASVRRYLEGKGIDGSRMTSVGYGESQPIADNETDAGRELNRRVELKVTDGNTGSTSSGDEPSLQQELESELDAEDAAPAADEAG